ncbi:uncharacterized protein KY384_001833 [Bacidia gigantensis]|uniref:uncharacterized protein n=1 Tax=Bacidia gigantensis TaxID=2732470 RepID=UPI001D05419F|nr:uncharacterized protein KY384_001833 [Bacidia gigantensis]KAG8533050.1 hypothetical protein KY384_001833 [Bacidia gigantensis]
MATSSQSLKSFLGKPIEICIVSRNHRRTLAALTNLGIGPWRIYTCLPTNTSEQTFRGKSSAFTMVLCFADLPGGMVYEVIEPVSGANIFSEFLEERGEGIHHVAYDCNDIPWEDRINGFEERGLSMAQGGNFRGENRFAFFESEEAGTCFETLWFREGYEYPEPEEWFPARPEKGDGELQGRS